MESINFSNGDNAVTPLGLRAGIRLLKPALTPQNHEVLDRARRSLLRGGGERDSGEECCVVKAEHQSLRLPRCAPAHQKLAP